jgi:hypothetical protein
MWEPRPLTPLWAFTPCYRDSFTFTQPWTVGWLTQWKGIGRCRHSPMEVLSQHLLEGIGKTLPVSYRIPLPVRTVWHSVHIERITSRRPQKRKKKLAWFESWNNSLDVGFEVLAAVIMKSAVLWAVTLCSSETVRRFGGTYSLLLPATSISFLLRGPWKWRCFPPTCWALCELHGVTAHNIVSFNFYVSRFLHGKLRSGFWGGKAKIGSRRDC